MEDWFLRSLNDEPDRYGAIAERLVADSRPVGRLKPVPSRVALCTALGVGAMAVFAVLSPRPDIAQRILVPAFVFEIIGFAVAGGFLALLGLRGAVPGAEPGAGAWSLAAVLMAIAAGSSLAHPIDPDALVGAFVMLGVPCAETTLALAIVPGLILFVALRRGVPLAPGNSGAFAGGSAVLLAYGAMRLHCPIDDGWHLFVWHALPIIPAMLVGAILGVLWLSRWQR